MARSGELQTTLTPAPPRYWRDETSGVLAAAVWRYLGDHALTPNELRYMREYCMQWGDSPIWELNLAGGTEELAALRASAKEIRTIQQLDKWVHDATDIGLDPL